MLFLPTWRGTQTLQEYQSAFGPGGSLPGGYSVSPQLSFFAPVGGFTLGGAISFSRIGDSSTTTNTTTPSSGSGEGHEPRDTVPTTITSTQASTSNYFSAALVSARRIGANSFGIELASLRGTGGGDSAVGFESSHSTSDSRRGD